MNRPASGAAAKLSSAVEYVRRGERDIDTPHRGDKPAEESFGDRIMFDSRLRHYDALFLALGLTPLLNQRVLDAGRAHGKWLEICCRRWGAQGNNCFGNDRRDTHWENWRQANPDTGITFISRPTHEIEFAPSSFDIVHQSMMLSSIVDRRIRAQSATVLWQLVRPGGFLISYDFWLNPLNPATVGIHERELRRLFPRALTAYRRSVTLAPPLCRKLGMLGKSAALALEKIRLLNTHWLIALMRPVEE